MKKLIALLILPFSLFADELDTAAVTNTWIVSNATNIKAWTRQAVMVKPDKTIIDPSGVFVDTATAAAQSNAVDKASSLADAAKLGMESAIEGLEAVTNQVPENAYQVSRAALHARASLRRRRLSTRARLSRSQLLTSQSLRVQTATTTQARHSSVQARRLPQAYSATSHLQTSQHLSRR